MDYSNLLTRAWRITWDHKILWLFGLLASLGQGGGGGGSGWRQSIPSGGGRGGPPGELNDLQGAFDRIPPAVWIGLAVVALLILLAVIVISTIGKGGLIGGIQIADAQGRVSFGEAWGQGLGNFGRIFLIGLVLGLAGLALVLLTVVPGAVLTALTFGLGLICLIPLICAVVLAIIALGVVGNLAQIAAVLDQLSVTEAIGRAWSVITSNLGNVIVLAIILALVGGVAGFLIALPILAIVFPVMMGVLAGTLADSRGLAAGGFVLAGLCFLAYLPVLLVFQGILTTWTTSVWTLAYRQFTGRAAVPVPTEPAAA